MSKMRLLSVLSLALSLSVNAATSLNATLYKDPNCGCCEAYVAYLKQHGFQVTAINTPDMARIKSQSGIPSAQASCHTTKVAGYVIEGHVPVSAINKLLTEKPKITGITAPGMPVNSPGMGKENGHLAVYAITKGVITSQPYGYF